MFRTVGTGAGSAPWARARLVERHLQAEHASARVEPQRSTQTLEEAWQADGFRHGVEALHDADDALGRGGHGWFDARTGHGLLTGRKGVGLVAPAAQRLSEPEHGATRQQVPAGAPRPEAGSPPHGDELSIRATRRDPWDRFSTHSVLQAVARK